MVAAIYARKSTEQSGVSDEQRSVARQVENARAYSTRNGWIVADDHIYIDDGISGAEFDRRPGFVRLMAAVGKHGAPFDVLIVADVDRLGRDSVATPYAIAQLLDAGVRIYSYADDREITLQSSTDTFMLQVQAFVASMEREKARQRTYSAMRRKAEAGHVTGGKVFGYTNVTITMPDGRRSHVERRINDGEAAVVREIFERCAEDWGFTRIAKALNERGCHRHEHNKAGRRGGEHPPFAPCCSEISIVA